MIRMWFANTLFMLVLCVCAHTAQAAIAIDVSQDDVAVTTGFDGATVTVFGVQDQPGQIAIVVEGPPRTMVIRKKERVLGLWTYTQSQTFHDIPSYYEVASSVPLQTLARENALMENHIGLDYLDFIDMPNNEDTTAPFQEVLFQLQQTRGHFVLEPQPVTYRSPHLFKGQFTLPTTVIPGRYTVRTYLFRDGVLIDQAHTGFEVRPYGLSASLRHFAFNNGLLYGLTGVILAMMAGFLATVLLKRD